MFTIIKSKIMNVKYSYLYEQFKNTNSLWSQLKKFVNTGDFTLGKPLEKFEKISQNLLVQNMPLV